MRISIKVVAESGRKKLFCPECNSAINAIWILENCKIEGVTTKCKVCGKTLQIKVE